jgi:hypothetical protein
MGTEVATVKVNSQVAWVDPKNMKRDAGKRYLSRVATSSRSPFVGRQVRANGQDGFLQIGYGDSAEQVDDMTVVINVPQTLATWQYWPEGEGPSYPFVAPIFGGATLPTREECGPKETKYNELKEEDEDVWKEGLVLILRDPKSGELMHMQCFGNVNSKAGEFALSVADAEELENGKLPLVKISFEKIKLKSKKSFYGVKFEVVDWVKAVKADMPAAMNAAVEAASEDDEDEAPKARKPSRRDVEVEEPKARKSRRVEPEEEDDAEDEEDDATDLRGKQVDHSKGNGKAAVKRARDEDEEDEDEDDKPRAVSRSAAKQPVTAKPATKRARREEPEEDEEEEQPVRRRRRAALN